MLNLDFGRISFAAVRQFIGTPQDKIMSARSGDVLNTHRALKLIWRWNDGCNLSTWSTSLSGRSELSRASKLL
jgi:hypothetical protein